MGKDAIIVNKESHFETTLNYHESTKVYENKKVINHQLRPTYSSASKQKQAIIDSLPELYPYNSQAPINVLQM